ncbi:hypothetical protein N7E81_10195 [Reichenbachiella carrageenanivorans]|uniref:Uncharacterized protein n=1 Tax=Reichenbachiella carrageenanivorans TaxID=2979869 RepID=A0ABY6CVH8_9BACT|nr:hypothetical protein [Reichenbachiella carrageenanivorans]UXX77739.1 hypothetical protein N7E81_10195 [Reichenbachiella carrageenanivorans]
MDKEVELKVSAQEVKLIFQALGKLPFEEVYDLIGKLNDQVNDQVNDQSK